MAAAPRSRWRREAAAPFPRSRLKMAARGGGGVARRGSRVMAAPEEPSGGRAGEEPGREAAGLSGGRCGEGTAAATAVMFRCGEVRCGGAAPRPPSAGVTAAGAGMGATGLPSGAGAGPRGEGAALGAGLSTRSSGVALL